MLEIVDAEAIRRRGFKVVLDACHGAGGRLGAALLQALGCRTARPGRSARRPLRPSARADRGQPERVRRGRAGRRRGGRLRPGSRRRSAGDRRRDRPLHRRGADAGAGGPATARAGEGAGRAQPLDLARDRGPGPSPGLPGLPHARSARSTSSSGCWPRTPSWAAREMAA